MWKNSKIFLFIISLFCFLLSGCSISDQSAISTIPLGNTIIETIIPTNIIATPSLSAVGQTILARDMNVQEIALDKNNIFLLTRVTQKQGNNSIENNRIERVPKNGGKIITLIEENFEYADLILDDKYAYWIAKDKTDPSHQIQSLKSINKNGGGENVLYQDDEYSIFSITQDNDYIVLFSRSTIDSKLLKIVQINKNDNAINTIFDETGIIANIVVHNGFIYWTDCILDSVNRQLTGEINRIIIGGNVSESIISDHCYGLPFASDKGIYWLGQYIIFVDDASDGISTIIDRSILERGYEITRTNDIHGDIGISKIISIDGKNIYFSIAQSMNPGFSSCTDESEAVWKYSFSTNTVTKVVSFTGRVDYYIYKNFVFIISKCNENNSKSINLYNEIISDILLRRIKLMAVDDTKIFWTDQEGLLLATERNDTN
jgi:hypothetical protein